MQIQLSEVSADYSVGPFRKTNVLSELSLSIEQGAFTAVIGETGAGKSSVLKLVNGLLLPTKGHLQVGEYTLEKNVDKQTLNAIRKNVGMVFQFPENQLFAETVYDDIAFGPRNFGFTEVEVERLVEEASATVGLARHLFTRSPFNLSGGQQRRVAIAGVLATEPEILVLDEPAAGLDPEGKRAIFDMLKDLHQRKGLTTVMVTHDMDDVVHYADDVIVMAKGEVKAHLSVAELFNQEALLKRYRLELPEVLRLKQTIEQAKGQPLRAHPKTVDELARAMIEEGWV